jgi:undecaprenyl-diphosphatase
MPLLHLFILAVVQGITEFLPISSSAHLILVPVVLDTPDQGLAIDVAVHVGTLLALLVYFRKEVAGMLRGVVSFIVPKIVRDNESSYRKLAAAVLVSAIPVVIVGLVLRATQLDQAMRSVIVIGWASLGFGVLLWATDKFGGMSKRLGDIDLPAALKIGLAQVLALIPGTSRAGITITAARAMGFERVDAARFSMFLALPVIAAAGTLSGYEIVMADDMVLGYDALVGMALSFLTAYATIAIFLRVAKNHTLLPFVIYRCALGVGLLLWGYGVWA